MSDLVDPARIEAIVGHARHPLRHYGRAVAATSTLYILHSGACLASGIDLRACPYSRALDRGIDLGLWEGNQDEAVALVIWQERLAPHRALRPPPR